MEINKKEVLKILKQKGRLSTTRIAAFVGMNNDRAKMLLEEMEKNKLIKKVEETLATYWEIN